MKVKELIAQLQELDPSGELYVDSVHYVDRLLGYYDGPCMRVNEDSIEFNDHDDKIRIYTMDVLQALDSDMEIILTLQARKERYEQYIKEQKQEMNKIWMQVYGKPKYEEIL